jgi:peptidoglycan-associated lipoprotein
MKKIILAACAALLVTACSHKAGSGSGEANAAAMEELKNKVGDRVFFEYDSSALTPEAKATLGRQSDFIKSKSDLKFIIEGHADERGTREYNIGLGERRANSVKKELQSKGVAADRLKVVSYGKERPATEGHDEAAWSQNRRGVTVIE